MTSGKRGYVSDTPDGLVIHEEVNQYSTFFKSKLEAMQFIKTKKLEKGKKVIALI